MINQSIISQFMQETIHLQKSLIKNDRKSNKSTKSINSRKYDINREDKLFLYN